MRTAVRLLLGLAFAAGCCGMACADGLLGAEPTGPPPAAQSGGVVRITPVPGSPTALIMPFYDHFGLERDPAQRSNFINPARKVLDDAEALEKSGQGECLDPNMALDNADADKDEIDGSLKMLEAIDGDRAKVVVAFVEGGKPHRLEWKLQKAGDAWKIADLLSVTGEWELSQYQCE